MESHLDAALLADQARQGQPVSASALLISAFSLRRIAQAAARSGAAFTVTSSKSLSLHDKETIEEVGKGRVTFA